MPELEMRIQRWRQTLALALGGADEIVSELESHLREEIDRRLAAGEEPLTALTAAQKQLGRPVDLAAEYAQAAAPVLWWPVLVCLALTILLMVSLILAAVQPLTTRAHADGLLLGHVGTLVAGYIVAFYAGFLGLCYVVCWLVRPISLGQRRSLDRTLLISNASAAILLLAGMLLGAVWMDRRQAPAWSNDPREICTLFAVLWFAGVSLFSWVRPRQQHLRALLSVIGVGVGIWCWFGPALLMPTAHSYGLAPIAVSLLVGAALPAAVALLGASPPGSLRRTS